VKIKNFFLSIINILKTKSSNMKNKEVTVLLMGGLGNQLFQIAAAKAISQKLSCKLLIDKSHPSINTHPFLLDAFSFEYETVKENHSYMKKHRKYISVFNKIYKNFKINFGSKFFYIEKDYSFQENFFKINEGKFLFGYFQSEKYFIQISKIIKEMFQIKTELSEENKFWVNKIKQYNSISLHIRRGDYISNPSAKLLHNSCFESNYYQEAINYITKYVQNPFFMIFSDEPDWIRKNFKIDFPYEIIGHDQKEQSYEDLRLMSLCKHNIIANSTFSWWGAWLNENPDKIVIAPKKWFNISSVDTKDIIPDAWVKL